MAKSTAESILSGDRWPWRACSPRWKTTRLKGGITLDELFPHTGKAHLIGVTGAPGTGKSSLVNQMALQYRKPASESQTGGDRGGGPLQPVHRRGGARRPGAHARPGRRPGRVHPLDGLARLAGRAGPGHRGRGAGLRRGRFRCDPDRNGRRRTDRSGYRPAGAYHPGGGSPRAGRRDPGHQGRHPGNRRYPGDQQGRPARSGKYRARLKRHARPGPPGREGLPPSRAGHDRACQRTGKRRPCGCRPSCARSPRMGRVWRS